MEAPFAFDSMLAFSWLSFFLLTGVLLRAKVGFIQKFLFPSCLVGGVIGLAAMHTGWLDLDVEVLETFGYHFFNLSFISVGLTRDSDPHDAPKGVQKLKGPAWMALVQGVTFPMQAIIGGLVVLAFGFLGVKLFSTFGFLVPLGFNEGPGQALSIGKAWEAVGFNNAATIGLTFAAVGFFFSFFVGVPLVNYGLRKGLSSSGPKDLPDDFVKGILPKDKQNESAGSLTLHSGNVETLAFQAAMMGVVYGITYVIMKTVGSFLSPDVASMIWGFFFFMGLGVALVVKKLMEIAGISHLADPGVQRRITGWSVDFLIVATIMAIQLQVVWKYILPIAAISLAVGILTTLVVLWFGKRVPGYNLERTAAIFGTVTGTVSCGLLLLRIADPEFRTPVAYEIAFMNVFAVPIVGGGSFLVNGPLWWDWSISLTVLVFAGIMLAAFGALKLLGLVTAPAPD